PPQVVTFCSRPPLLLIPPRNEETARRSANERPSPQATGSPKPSGSVLAPSSCPRGAASRSSLCCVRVLSCRVLAELRHVPSHVLPSRARGPSRAYKQVDTEGVSGEGAVDLADVALRPQVRQPAPAMSGDSRLGKMVSR